MFRPDKTTNTTQLCLVQTVLRLTQQYKRIIRLSFEDALLTFKLLLYSGCFNKLTLEHATSS